MAQIARTGQMLLQIRSLLIRWEQALYRYETVATHRACNVHKCCDGKLLGWIVKDPKVVLISE